MKDFIIKEINKHYARYLVFGTSAESPLFQLSEIRKELDVISGEKVLFDQLLQTGNAGNRFLSIDLLNDDFDLNSAKNIDAKIIDDETKICIASFLRENTPILKYSILLSSQKEVIFNGGII